MIDLKAARNDPDGYRAALARKGAAEAFDAVLEADERWRALVPRIDELRSKTKLKGKPSPEQLAEMQQVKEELKAAEEELAAAEAARDELALRVPNLPHPDIPDGSTEDDVAEIRRVGEPPALEEARGAHRGRPLRDGARREDVRRPVRLLGRRHRAARARALPARARTDHREGLHRRAAAGARARGGADRHRLHSRPTRRTSTSSPRTASTSPAPPRSRWPACTRARSSPPTSCRSGTSAFSPCFRREAGAAGRDTRGMIRVHQFNKVEQFSFTRPEDSWDEHELLLANTEELVQRARAAVPGRRPAGRRHLERRRRRPTTSRSGSRARTATGRPRRSRTRPTSRRGGSGSATAATAARSRCTR